jgi:hypothetical protein
MAASTSIDGSLIGHGSVLGPAGWVIHHLFLPYAVAMISIRSKKLHQWQVQAGPDQAVRVAVVRH